MKIQYDLTNRIGQSNIVTHQLYEAAKSKFHGNQYTEVSSPNGEHTKIHTDKEIAKMDGVETGTKKFQ